MNFRLIRRRVTVFVAIVGSVALASFGGVHVMQAIEQAEEAPIPSTPVKRSTVVFTVTAKGDLQGGNSRMLTAPMTGSAQLVVTDLRKPGEMVKEGDIVVAFDTTEETFKLREAESDLAESEQQVIQAQLETLAKQEELNAELIKARADVQVAELECARNELLAAIAARQNDLTLEAARDKLLKLEQDYPARKAAASASIAIQDAARAKAGVQADTARRNIDNMTLKAPVAGYVNVERNTNSNWFFPGMTFPLFQVGDAARPGMAVAQIPDLATWEVTARIAEQDRGHISVGQPAQFTMVALPGRSYKGKVSDLGGTTGPPWDRRFECKMTLEQPSPDLRPGMSVRIVLETGRMENALAIPAQALFERDGKPFVYINKDGAFSPQDVKLVRRSESQAVIEGLREGQLLAMASPDQKARTAEKGAGGATGAIRK